MKYNMLFTQLILQSLTYNKLYVYITDISKYRIRITRIDLLHTSCYLQLQKSYNIEMKI